MSPVQSKFGSNVLLVHGLLRRQASVWVRQSGLPSRVVRGSEESMDQLLQFESAGGAVLVEVADDEPGIERAARVDEVVVKARASLEGAMEQVRTFANATLGKVQDLPQQPEQIEMEFGIRLNAEAGAVIARTQAEGHLQIKLTWTRPKLGGADRGA